ncbi:hypothetical protein AA0312_1774 [Acetobacter tropicalis NRIC 0312]|uniref:Uncharacterized protein n=1 Tax=Acetobacter tropicalis TaxID=104102 RepID=A0A511FS13_9PROT|nr:hypothetical protein ATR1_050c0011 [Acetobacter tropicalis]GBR70292.1 hypothetical protein AA0312_1774 [Acetobacter tropicalis NRIC 0312]GEL51695.1 hypothetical protein ATR01nite_27700 [Acetobacter tropicalis]
MAAAMRPEEGIEPITLTGSEMPRQQFTDIPFGIEQRLAHHALDLGDTGHDDVPTAELVQQHPCEDDPAGGRQGGRQKPGLKLGLERSTELLESEYPTQGIELFIPGRPTHGIVGERIRFDPELETRKNR